MSQADRARRLGPEAAARFKEIGATAPPPSPELIAVLRRIFALNSETRAERDETA